MSGDFLPKRSEIPEGTLCVCFVAILRARNVEGVELQARRNYLGRSGGRRSSGRRTNCQAAIGSARHGCLSRSLDCLSSRWLVEYKDGQRSLCAVHAASASTRLAFH